MQDPELFHLLWGDSNAGTVSPTHSIQQCTLATDHTSLQGADCLHN